jgi:hypothetical protein
MSYSSAQLGKNIQATASNRFIKIAYIIPYQDTEENHFILDAVFHESYTRWGGARTLIIPSDPEKFLHTEHEKWLEFFDPDFIYTYVDLDLGFIKKISLSCYPIFFLKHEKSREGGGWRTYLPSWSRHAINPVSSITTLPRFLDAISPRATVEPTIVTQDVYQSSISNRFVRDNFGTAGEISRHTNPVEGFFNTLALISDDGQSRQIGTATRRTTFIKDVLSDIASGKALSFAQLASACCKNTPTVYSYEWSTAFNIFIGGGCLDRINFWNARHFVSEDRLYVPSSLIIASEDFFNDKALVKQLGSFLNSKNWLNSGGGGDYKVCIRSLSLEKTVLESIANKLKVKGETFNSVYVPKNFNASSLPTAKELSVNFSCPNNCGTTTFKLNETKNEIAAIEPAHFSFIPQKFYTFKRGQWGIDLDIERHNSHSNIVNQLDNWQIPRRHGVSRCFTTNLSKITKHNLLSLVPNNPSSHFTSHETPRYKLELPDDETVFRYIVLESKNFDYKDDVRSDIEFDRYKDIAFSNKGQNLRGVISMFDSLDQACNCLTNKIWMKIIRECSRTQDSNEITERDYYKNGELKKERIIERPYPDKLFSQKQLFGFWPNSDEYTQLVKDGLRLSKKGKWRVVNYINKSFCDSLEFLVKKNVFFQVHSWRCSCCGHNNVRSVDELKKENKCGICQKIYYAPIDLEWSYKLNKFASDSLCGSNNSLSVLWALDYLKSSYYFGRCFYFLPEVDLYVDEGKKTKSEIDLLCVMGRKLIAGEAKKTACAFLNEKAISSFVKQIQLIRPDIAILAFEGYGCDPDKLQEIKSQLENVKETIEQSIVDYGLEVNIIIADELSEYPIQLYPIGKRVRTFLQKMDAALEHQ